VEFPLYQLGHLTKPREVAWATECVADKKEKITIKKGKNNEFTDSVQNTNPGTSHPIGARRARRVDGRAGDGNA
jgi:hypothetical protein